MPGFNKTEYYFSVEIDDVAVLEGACGSIDALTD